MVSSRQHKSKSQMILVDIGIIVLVDNVQRRDKYPPVLTSELLTAPLTSPEIRMLSSVYLQVSGMEEFFS